MKRGEAGAKALRQAGEERVKRNKRILKKALDKYKGEKIPFVKSEFSEECGLSIATLNRSPYREMIREYLDEEKALLSPGGKQEVAALIKSNRELKEELKIISEKYNRLKKEMNYSKYLY